MRPQTVAAKGKSGDLGSFGNSRVTSKQRSPATTISITIANFLGHAIKIEDMP